VGCIRGLFGRIHMSGESQRLRAREPEEVALFRAAILSGKPWYLALLEMIGRWALPEEEMGGRNYRYLLHGEAFDWLLLAERLCSSADGLIPEDEYESLVFRGLPPERVDEGVFRRLVGSAKYRGILNFWYGVVAEEALQLVVEDGLRKERRAAGFADDEGFSEEETFKRLYGEGRAVLLRAFRKEMGYPQRRSTTLTELKEFTYWLFKRRVNSCEPARVASDTRRGLTRLRELRSELDPF